MREFKVKSEETVTDQQVADWAITAFEGGINYWCEEAMPMERDEHGDWYEMIGEQYTQWQIDGVGAYANPEFWDNDTRGYQLSTDEGVEKKVLTLSAMLKALNHQPKRTKGICDNWYRKMVSRLMTDNYDAADADCLVQVAIFNEVIYG